MILDSNKLDKLCKGVVNYSLKVKPGMKVMIRTAPDGLDLAKRLVREIGKAGGMAFPWIMEDGITREMGQHTPDIFKHYGEIYGPLYDKCDALIAIRTGNNNDMNEIDMEVKKEMAEQITPYSRKVTSDKPWVLFLYPTTHLADTFKMSEQKFADYWLDVSSFDYSKMAKACEPLNKLMTETDKVEIKGPGTDLTFSLKGIGAVSCCGNRNIPDGECYSAPVKDSVEGYITYNMLSPQMGEMFKDVKLTFKAGKIVEATCDGGEEMIKKLNEIFDQDEGARYIGEFAIGFNPFIDEGVGNILFDEKMKGSFHFTPGNAYANAADNTNRSKLHWDLVCSQQPKHGGGEIYFDGKLIRKDGEFVIKELEGLNAKNLAK